MTTALDNVMAQAEAAAAAHHVPEVATYQPPALQQQQGGVPMKRTLQSANDNAGILVENYLLPKTEGLKIGNDMKGLLDEVVAILDMSDVVVISQIRANTGGNTTFVKSYDGVTTSGGQNFMAELARLQKTNEKVDGPYDTVEVPFELAEDVKDPKGSEVYEEGLELGYTPSLTGYKEFQRFMKKLSKEDPALLGARLKVKLIHEKKTNSKNNEWGVVRFELLEVLD